MTNFVRVAPGGNIKISRKLSADLIRSVRDRMVDLTANVAVAGLFESNVGDKPVEFVEKLKITIKGQDKIDFDNGN